MTACAKVAVYVAEPDDSTKRKASQLAQQSALPLTETPDPAYDVLLTVTADRLELRFTHPGGPRPLYVDFVGGRLGYARRVPRFGLLYQAIGFKSGRPTVLDATAGLGRDAFRLAHHGCEVTAIERSPVLFALLQDGLDRASREPEIHKHLGDRLHLLHADAREILRRLSPAEAPDVIYLDPMFPPKKKSALVKKEMRILRQLVGDDPDAGELCNLARAVARQRVVVKRLRHAEPLAPNPAHTHRDKTTRYDVYLTPRIPLLCNAAPRGQCGGSQ